MEFSIVSKGVSSIGGIDKTAPSRTSVTDHRRCWSWLSIGKTHHQLVVARRVAIGFSHRRRTETAPITLCYSFWSFIFPLLPPKAQIKAITHPTHPSPKQIWLYFLFSHSQSLSRRPHTLFLDPSHILSVSLSIWWRRRTSPHCTSPHLTPPPPQHQSTLNKFVRNLKLETHISNFWIFVYVAFISSSLKSIEII